MKRLAAATTLIILLTAVAAWVHLYEFNTPVHYDSYVYLLMGKFWAEGLLPYRDAAEIKPPGVFLYFATVFRLVSKNIWSVRFSDFLVYLGGAAGLYRLCRRQSRAPVACGAVAAWLFLAHHPLFNLGGFYTEEYASIATICAVAAAAAYSNGGPALLAFMAGVAAALAALCKQPGTVAFGPVAILCVVWRPPGARRLTAAALAGFGAAVPVAVACGYFWWHDALTDLLDYSLWKPMAYGQLHGASWLWRRLPALAVESEKILRYFPWVGIALLIGAIGILARPRRAGLLALLWLLLELVAVAAQRNFYLHYFIPVLAPVCLVAALGAGQILALRGRRGIVRYATIAAAALLIAFFFPTLKATYLRRQPLVETQWRRLLGGPALWQRHPGTGAEANIGAYIRARTRPEDRIHMALWHANFLGAYWTADRHPAVRNFFQAAFPLPRSQPLEDLQHNPPAYVVTIGSGENIGPLTAWLTADYTLETVKYFDHAVGIWARNRSEAFASGAMEHLVADGPARGLTLPVSGPTADAGMPTRTAVRRGRWTSPVLEVLGDDGAVSVDWHGQADALRNRTAEGFPRATLSVPVPGFDPAVLLGAPRLADAWGVNGRTSISLDLGNPVVADRIVFDSRSGANALAEIVVETGDGAAVPGVWHSLPPKQHVYQFDPLVVRVLRIGFRRATPRRPFVVTRIRLPMAGMGIVTRYRSGPSTDLASLLWSVVGEPSQGERQPAQRYVQVQCELWSEYAGVSPVLRYVQIGRQRFQSNP